MKKIIAFLVVLISMMQYGVAQTDTILNELTKKTVGLQTSIDATKKELIDSLKSGFAKRECNCIQDF